jgi:hypothetical protein
MTIQTVGSLKSDLGEFSLTSEPQAFAFFFFVQRICWPICDLSSPFGLFAICLTMNFGSLVQRLLYLRSFENFVLAIVREGM